MITTFTRLIGLLLLGPVLAHAAPRVATSDWSTAETLTAMQLPPVSAGDKRAYQTWIGTPKLPDSTLDAGLRFQPNLELLRQIKPDFFIQSAWFAHLKPQFETIAPVHEVNFATEQGIDYANTLAATRQIGRLVGQPQAAEKLIERTRQQFARQRQQLSSFSRRPLAVIQFIDPRQARIYGDHSLYGEVFKQLNLRNAWQGQSNQWGFANIQLADLAKLPPDTLLLIVPPNPRNVFPTLEHSALWQRLPFSKPQNRRILPVAWSYGALPSMQHFADVLTTALLTERREIAW